ncbi:hypothetical protein RL72_00149 [Microbacterium azadirachtae]|uniref:Uncharacterized protein n=1 Tax=Microbacterium azadirachtae TaxID=582680 RepID=A0A0F0LHV8_9MICO|nr:hypothetical protein RL72_00149 [Microbacterium azadirachtae]
MSELPSISTDPICCGRMACETMPPTATSLRPRCAAAARSTCTEMYGSDAERLLETWFTPAEPLSSFTSASAAVVRVLSSGAVILTWMSLDPKPSLAAIVMSPTPSSFFTAARTSACTASWSAEGSVVIE